MHRASYCTATTTAQQQHQRATRRSRSAVRFRSAVRAFAIEWNGRVMDGGQSAETESRDWVSEAGSFSHTASDERSMISWARRVVRGTAYAISDDGKMQWKAENPAWTWSSIIIIQHYKLFMYRLYLKSCTIINIFCLVGETYLLSFY